MSNSDEETLECLHREFTSKFVTADVAFATIHPGDRIFISTGCGEPQYLVRSLIGFVESRPQAFFDAEVLHVWTLGVAPYADEKFKRNFRLNTFFIGNHTREAVNRGAADYLPAFLSQVPMQIRRGLIPVNIALVQTSMPDAHGFFSLGISVDIAKAAIEMARTVIVQVNPNMPRIHGDTFIHIDDIDFVVVHEEPLLEYTEPPPNEVFQRIGQYVARIVEDGDTIQIGYGNIPNAVLNSLGSKHHLGVHTELFVDGLADLMRRGVIDNTLKSNNRNKSVAAFCMGKHATYHFLHNNPAIEFRPVDYTNDPLVIARQHKMTAINTALQVDLTGQASAESIGTTLYSGIGGQADFMRGAALAQDGKNILALPSTSRDGKHSRIVLSLPAGTGVTLTRGDIQYVVTEYGIAHLRGKNIRERAMSLISIAHPKFRNRLIQQAKKNKFIYPDQAFVPGKCGEYPEHLEVLRTPSGGQSLLLRPVKLSDEPLLKDFLYSLSDKKTFQRFMSTQFEIPHQAIQEMIVIDYTQKMVILAILRSQDLETVVGVGQYNVDSDTHNAEAAIAVRDNHQGQGIGTSLLRYLIYLARKEGLLSITALIRQENRVMLHLVEKFGVSLTRRINEGMFEVVARF